MKKSATVKKYKSKLSPRQLKFNPPKPILVHAIQDMHWYVTRHFFDAEEPILRHKILQIKRYTESATNRKKLRGLLCYLKRWPTIKVYMTIADVLEKEMEGSDICLEPGRIINCINQNTVMKSIVMDPAEITTVKLEIKS